MDFGVTSTYSSFLIYSIHCSNENLIAGAIEDLSSVPEALTLLCFFVFVMLTKISSSLVFSPITCPA